MKENFVAALKGREEFVMFDYLHAYLIVYSQHSNES